MHVHAVLSLCPPCLLFTHFFMKYAPLRKEYMDGWMDGLIDEILKYTDGRYDQQRYSKALRVIKPAAK